MKQNILIVSYDYEFSKQIAKRIAETFSMRLFDELELFLFDHMPRTYDEIMTTLGKDYIYNKLKWIVNSAVEFVDIVFVADINFTDYCEQIFDKLKVANFIIILTKPIEKKIKELNNKKYWSKAEKELFLLDEETLEKKEEKIIQDLADIVIEADDLNEDQIVDEIVNKIKEFYNVN